MKGKSTKAEYSHLWTIPEILLAGAILAHYHSLCGLIFGMGIKDDIDITLKFDKKVNSTKGRHTSVEDEALMSEMEDKTIGYLKKRVEDDQYCFDDDISIDSEPSLARHKS